MTTTTNLAPRRVICVTFCAGLQRHPNVVRPDDRWVSETGNLTDDTSKGDLRVA